MHNEVWGCAEILPNYVRQGINKGQNTALYELKPQLLEFSKMTQCREDFRVSFLFNSYLWWIQCQGQMCHQ